MRLAIAGSALAALCLLASPGLAARSERFEVIVLLSQELAPYRAAIESFESEGSMRVRELDLRGDINEAAWAVREIRSLKPDMILSVGSLATQIVGDAITDIPIIFCMTTETPESALKPSNITGVTLMVSPNRQFQTLRQLLPDVHTVGVVFDPAHSSRLIAEASIEASAAGLALITRAVTDPKEVPGAVRGLLEKVEMLWMIPDSTCFTRESFEFALNLSAEKKFPLMVFSEAYVRAGALFSLSPDYTTVGRQAARMARRIHAGESIRSVPPETPDQPRLVINRRAASNLKTSFSAQAFEIAAQVVEQNR